MRLTSRARCIGTLASTFVLLAVGCLGVSTLYADGTTAVGLWQAVDNKTGKPNSHIRVWEENGKLFGKIEKLFKEPAQDQNPKCVKCEGDKKDKPILGMTILWDMKKKGERWEDGRIMDPDEGKTYGCKLELAEGGKKLKVRGFMGFSMIGRTEYWQRVE